MPPSNDTNNKPNRYIGFIFVGVMCFLGFLIVAGSNSSGIFIAENKVCDPINESDCAEVDEGQLMTTSKPRVETPLIVFAAEVIGAPTTLIDNTIIDSYNINVTAGSWIATDELQINSGTGRFFRGTVLSVSNNTLTLDRALDFNFSTSESVVLEINTNMAVDGSVAPRIFQVGPVGEDTQAFISRIIIDCVDNKAGDNSKFCGEPALVRGITMRYSDGFKFNIFNIKTNGDLFRIAYDTTYTDKAGGGLFGMTSRLSFAGDSKQGTFLFIANDTTIEYWVQDDMTIFNELTITNEGYFKISN